MDSRVNQSMNTMNRPRKNSNPRVWWLQVVVVVAPYLGSDRIFEEVVLKLESDLRQSMQEMICQRVSLGVKGYSVARPHSRGMTKTRHRKDELTR